MCKLKLKVNCLFYQSLRYKCLITGNMEVSHTIQKSKSDRRWIMYYDKNANYIHKVKINSIHCSMLFSFGCKPNIEIP